MMLEAAVLHNFEEESLEAKGRWFQSLSLEERMKLLCEFTDLILSINPGIVDQKDAEPVAGRILVVVSRNHLIDSKRAAGRDKDLEDIKLLEIGEEDE